MPYMPYIYHQYTPVMLAYIPYMDTMGENIQYTSVYTGSPTGQLDISHYIIPLEYFSMGKSVKIIKSKS